MKSLGKVFYFLIVAAFLWSSCGGGGDYPNYDDNAAVDNNSDEVITEEPTEEVSEVDPWQEIREAVEGGERVTSEIDFDGEQFFILADERGFSYDIIEMTGFVANYERFVAYPNPYAEGFPTILALPSAYYYEEFPNDEIVAIVMDLENRWDSENPVYVISFEQFDDETGYVIWENEFGERFKKPAVFYEIDSAETEIYFVEGSCLLCIKVDSRRPCFFCW